MNFADLLAKLAHIFHIFGGGNETGITTFDPSITTTPQILIDTTTLRTISESDRSVSPKFSPNILSSTYGLTDENVEKHKTVTGITGHSEFDLTTDKTKSSEKTQGTVTGSDSTVTGESPATGETVSGSTASGGTTSDSTVSGSIVTGETGSTVTGKTGSTVTRQTGSTVTGQTGSTVTGETGSTVTGQTGSTVTGQTGSTVSEGTSTTVAPTAEPKGLSRGAVAGIVIGCLLLVAVVAAAIVFFLKNRNAGPEHQRLRV